MQNQRQLGRPWSLNCKEDSRGKALTMAQPQAIWIKQPQAILAEGAGGGIVVEGARIVELLPVGATPSEPASAAARSDRMSACRLVATTVSIERGLRTIRMVIASTSSLSQVTSL